MSVARHDLFLDMKRFLSLIIVLAALGGGGYWFWVVQSAPLAANTSLTGYLAGDDIEGFAQATEPGGISLPADLGAHDDYQTEWWYYTGNLETESGRQFGYQFTIFRRALTPPTEFDPDSESDWRSNQIYFAHFAVSDIDGGAFYNFDKFSRGAAGLAGAESVPYYVWIEDWYVQEQEDGSIDLWAETDEVSLALNMTLTRPPVFHGDGGLSQKGDAVGNASYYYSLVDQASVGTVTIGEEQFEVTGHSWKDHEYSTSALEGGAVGWDWFSLVFDNSDENALMYFNIRKEDGSIQAQSGGSWIAADSSVTKVTHEQVEIEVLDTWRSPRSGAVYPAAWRFSIPDIGLEMEGRSLLPDQELSVAQVYWEGAVEFEGTLNGEPLTALGYVEMTGYGE